VEIKQILTKRLKVCDWTSKRPEDSCIRWCWTYSAADKLSVQEVDFKEEEMNNSFDSGVYQLKSY